ncbi:MAG: hypothetical protein VKI42_00095 [Synechococcaceae cyanobacterium]|nr:hypothetical protein [Synechococcaceae cyanobacterium]
MRALAALLRHGLAHLHPSRAAVRVAGLSRPELEPPALLLRGTTSREGPQQSHDWLDTTVTIPASGGTIALHGEDAHLLPALNRTMNDHVTTKALPVPLRGEQMPSVRLSDHSPFWDQGYNAMMVTDTSFLRNPLYHDPTDTIATLDLPFLMAVIDGLELALGGLV